MRIALAQMRLQGADVQVNLDKALHWIDEASDRHADLICFPELQLHEFFPQYQDVDTSNYLLPLSDPRIETVKKRCKAKNIHAVPNFYVQEGIGKYDASLFINQEGALLGLSKMVHIINAHQFYEKNYYTPSDDGFKVFQTPIGKIGVIVCFDRHLPESFRLCALQGAQLILIPTANVKNEPLKVFEWELRIAAMQNHLFIAMCNRVGIEGEMAFAGESLVVGPDGSVIAKANDREQLFLADIDLAAIEAVRRERDYLQVRRPEMYHGLIQ